MTRCTLLCGRQVLLGARARAATTTRFSLMPVSSLPSIFGHAFFGHAARSRSHLTWQMRTQSDVEIFNAVDGVGMSAEHIASQMDASEVFRRNHTRMRQLVLRGHRLTENDFNIIQILNQPVPPPPPPPGDPPLDVQVLPDARGDNQGANLLSLHKDPTQAQEYCRAGSSGIISLV